MFRNNDAGDNGGGMSASGSATLTDCTFSGNRAEEWSGGGMCTSGNPQLIDCTFEGNWAHGAGGGVYSQGGSPTLINCTFSRNSAEWGGGGMTSDYGSPMLTWCVFTGNSGYFGGGIGGWRCAPTITNCVFEGNSARHAGGGVYASGPDSDALIANCLIIGNSGSSGAGICCESGAHARIVNCTISGNSASEFGGGVHCDNDSDVEVSNCILWANAAGVGPEIAVGGYGSPSTLSVSWCDVEGGQEAVYVDEGCTLIWGDGNIDDDPEFAFPDDCHLISESPCIDAGDNEAVPPEVTTDLDGNPRILGDPPIVDMGAYEFNSDAPSIALSPAELEFFAPEGGPNPDDQVVSIRNCGGQTLNSHTDQSCSWLQVDPPSGQSTGEIDDATVSVNVGGLSHGDYPCVLTVSDDQAVNTPRFVDAILHVNKTQYVPPYPTIQAAIDDSIDGDEVVVAEGEYTGPGNRDLDFGGRAITVRSTNPEDPEVVAATVIDCEGSPEDPHRGFAFHSGEGPDSVVAGFTITGGYAGQDIEPGFGGGAVFCVESSPTISLCVIQDNVAYSGGGVACQGDATIRNCLIERNFAPFGGGGIFCIGGTISNCTVTANSTYYAGAGLLCVGSTIANCTINDNEVLVHGGGLAAIGGAPYGFPSDSTVVNCRISGNLAGVSGGGIGVLAGSLSVTNCTITRNAAVLFGGGVSCEPYSPSGGDASCTLTNCILWQDNAGVGPEIGLLADPIYMLTAIAEVAYCDVEGGEEGVWAGPGTTLIWGDGNIDEDPRFADPDNEDFHLLPCSPCIDAGDSTAVPPDGADLDDDGDTEERTPLDLDGNPRFVDVPGTDDTGVPDPPEYPEVVDMGAYEVQFGRGDLNCDGLLDFWDINPFVLALSDPEAYETAYPGCNILSADINCDDQVDFWDINPFVALLTGR